MAKWIQDFSVGGATIQIPVSEVQGFHKQIHNAISGSPIFSTRLIIPWGEVPLALSRLLGVPERWPHPTTFNNMRCISAEIFADGGAYTTDGDRQIMYPSDNAFVDVTYTQRNGIYVTDYNGQNVYWEDTLEPRLESIPMNAKDLIWGKLEDETVPTDKIPLHPDEAPSKYEPGATLIHLIEGWGFPTDDIGFYLGTTNDEAYYSYNLNRLFPAKTLMLRNWNEIQQMSFRSWRTPMVPPPSPPNNDDPTTGVSDDGAPKDRSGWPTSTLRLIYEYKKEGWEKFWRNDVKDNVSGWYYIKRNGDPWSTVKPYLPFGHNPFLKKTAIN